MDQKLFFRNNRDNLILGLVCFYGIYAHVAAHYNLSFPVKSIVIACSVFLLILSSLSASVANQLKCIIGLSFLGIEPIMFILPVIYLPKILNYFIIKKNIFRYKKWSALIIGFFGLEILQISISNIFDFSLFTIIFWFVIFGFSCLLFVFFAEKEYSEDVVLDVFRFFKRLIQIQIVVLLVQFLFHRRVLPGDDWNGTFLDADKSGFYLLLLFLFYFAPPLLNKGRSFARYLSIKRIMYFLLLLAFLIMCDSKIKNMLVLSGLFLISVVIAVPFLIKKRSFVSYRKSVIFIVIFLFSFSVIFSAATAYLRYISPASTSLLSVVKKYTYAPPDPEKARMGINGKYLLYKKVYFDLFVDSPVKWFWGEGPGKFGSRTSNMMAYDLLFKYEDQFKLPEFIHPYSSPLAQKYMEGMWTKEKAEFVKYISSNLSIPFAGLVTIKGEMGILGVIYFLIIILFLSIYLLNFKGEQRNPDLNDWALVLSIFWISLPVQMLVDNIQEKPQIMYPMFLLTAIILGMNSSKAQQEKLNIL